MADLKEAERIHSRIVELRRRIHQYPELAFDEVRTAEAVIGELRSLGLPYEYQGKRGGVIARLRGTTGLGPSVAIRADMDGLPCLERTGLPFSSRIDGVMHACGHDAHVAMVLGAARLLAQAPPRGEVVFVFQPAEESGEGAKSVLDTGALRNVRSIFGGHVAGHYKVGEIMVAEGAVTSQSDRFSVLITGKGGHGARPHEGIDAVVIAASFINAVQTLVSRETNPVHAAVITIGKVEAGTAANVIAETAKLEGSIRSTLPEVREHLHRGIRRMAAALEELHNAKILVNSTSGSPPVLNSPLEAEICQRAASRVVGNRGVRAQDFPSMGSEDFSYYLQEMPGCYVRLGCRSEAGNYVPLHSPNFDIDEDVLMVGAAFFDEVAREAIQRYS